MSAASGMAKSAKRDGRVPAGWLAAVSNLVTENNNRNISGVAWRSQAGMAA